jgi:hypothetical protein
MNSYNYPRFSPDQYDFTSTTGPLPGEKAPDRTLYDLRGEQVRLLDFDGQFMVMEFGSATCPLFQSRRAAMTSLTKLHPEVSFRIIYVREAHPGQKLPAHESLTLKRNAACTLRDEWNEGRDVLVDDLDGSVHWAYGALPNPVFILNRNGCVVFRSDWNDPRAVGVALSQLLDGKPAAVRSYFKPAHPVVALRTLRRGGRGSAADFFKGIPLLIWSNLIKRNLLSILRRHTAIAPTAGC